MIAHSDEGALGIVLTNSAKVATVGELLEQLELPCVGSHEQAVHVGGPVQVEIGWIIYRPNEQPAEGEIKLSQGVAVTQSREVLSRIGRNEGPDVWNAYLGYSGWAPGQLEEEIRQGAWLPMDLHDIVVFDVPIAERWTRAYELAGVSPTGFMSTRRGIA
jgi:putative transcriptional regulator